jgi:hypothetical protein
MQGDHSMAMPLQTVTLLFPVAQVPIIVTRLTTHLLQHRYDFLQTCHDTTHADFDIFQNQRPLVRLTLRAAETPEALSGAAVLASSPALAADAVGIIQHLLQA